MGPKIENCWLELCNVSLWAHDFSSDRDPQNERLVVLGAAEMTPKDRFTGLLPVIVLVVNNNVATCIRSLIYMRTLCRHIPIIQSSSQNMRIAYSQRSSALHLCIPHRRSLICACAHT